MAVHKLKVAESPYKIAMLEMLDGLRAEVEAGEVIGIVALPMHPSREWSTYSAGEMSCLEKIGMLTVSADTYVKQCHGH